MINETQPTDLHNPLPILGAGSWGTALALHLSRLGQTIRLWTFDKAHIANMQRERANTQYLPGHHFPKTLLPTTELTDALLNAKEILIAVPSVAFRKLLIELKPLLNPETAILWATKGLDEVSGQLLHEVTKDILGNHRSCAILSGPSYAKEVAAGLPTAVVLASLDQAFADSLSKRFNSSTFRVYISHDIIGVEVGGAIKNVIAIATGISDGMGFGTNARCALITRGLAEITRLGLALGGQYETFTGLTGLGDLVLTCTDNQSRNRRFGLHLGEGMNAEDAASKIGQVVEGKRNAELVVQLASKMNVEMPISESVFKILQGKITCKEAMNGLLSRVPKSERN